MEPHYDTHDGIMHRIETLAGLRQLIADRAEAAYKRHEHLSEWLVSGRLWLDACGNAMKATEGITDKVAAALGPVLSWDEFHRRLPERGASFVLGRCVPGHEDVCARCKKSWTITDWWTARWCGDEKWRHADCDRDRIHEETVAFFRNALREAGYPPSRLREIPNEYSRDYYNPWLLVNVTFGVLKVGHRKRVIVVDWSDTDDLSLDFSAEGVTCGPDYVHAWGRAKLVEYLARIREAGEASVRA